MDVRFGRMSHPQSGRTSWLLVPTVSVEVFSLALATFAKGGWEQGQTNTSCWCSIVPAGTAVLFMKNTVVDSEASFYVQKKDFRVK
jgi:hypothetical protein